ncbi:hypothetical protein [Caldiplasma sukawensis]
MGNQEDNFWYIILYLVPLVGAIAYIILEKSQSEGKKFHVYQSSVEGVFLIIIYIIGRIISSIIIGTSVGVQSFSQMQLMVSEVTLVSILLGLISLSVWLYGLYVGYNAMQGKDMRMIFFANIVDKIS